MPLNKKKASQNTLAGILILMVFILVCYFNTFNNSWHFDDLPNIVHNTELHINNLNFDSILQTFYALPADNTKLYRPIPCLSFALNWYFYKDNVFGYHIINFIIHLLSTAILFHTMISLFDTPKLKGKWDGREYFIALLAAALWAIHPIQTQAVAYIVQRMASMAALFYILCVYLYINARISRSIKRRILLFILCGISFIFSFFSKENAIFLPISLLLIEFIFFDYLNNVNIKKKFLGALTVFLAIFLFSLLIFIIMKGNPIVFIEKMYTIRNFSLTERLLTEHRVLIMYLYRLIYPVSSLLSIEHDITLSTSFFTPWTTLPSIILLYLLATTALIKASKWPFFSFAILFFLLNHIIESSILPLEIVFEHRNYLPSMFFFLPFAVLIQKGLLYYSKTKRYMQMVIILFVTILLAGTGYATYVRNMDWATEETLWLDAMKKAPGRARPCQNLANFYARNGQKEKADELYAKAMNLKDSKPKYAREISLLGMAELAYQKKEYVNAISLYETAIKESKKSNKGQYKVILSLIRLGKLHEAAEKSDRLLLKKPNDKRYLYIKGFILLKQNQVKESIPYFKLAVKNAPDYNSAIFNLGVAYSLTGKYNSAEKLLRLSQRLSLNSITTFLALIENSYRAGDVQKKQTHLDKMLKRHSVATIKSELKKLLEENNLYPLSGTLLKKILADHMRHLGDEFGELEIEYSTKI